MNRSCRLDQLFAGNYILFVTERKNASQKAIFRKAKMIV